MGEAGTSINLRWRLRVSTTSPPTRYWGCGADKTRAHGWHRGRGVLTTDLFSDEDSEADSLQGWEVHAFVDLARRQLPDPL